MKNILVLVLLGELLFSGCGTEKKTDQEGDKKESGKEEEAGKDLDCADFKTGKFQGTGVQTDIFIDRNDSMQIEYTPYGDVVLKVDWISDCEYDLTILQPMNDSMANEIGKVYHITITDIRENEYFYVCRSGGSTTNTSKGSYIKTSELKTEEE